MIDEETDLLLALEAFTLFGDHTPYEGRFVEEVKGNRTGFPPWNKGQKLPAEVKRKMSEARLANPTGTTGKSWTWSDEARERLSRQRRSKVRNK